MLPDPQMKYFFDFSVFKSFTSSVLSNMLYNRTHIYREQFTEDINNKSTTVDHGIMWHIYIIQVLCLRHHIILSDEELCMLLQFD
jgi:hypothetical protein